MKKNEQNIPIPIICFPHAGGHSYQYKKFEKFSNEKYQWLTIEYPGRGRLASKSFCHTMSDLVTEMYNQVEPYLFQKPIFFGHSLGALVAYELCCHLQELKAILPKKLYLSSAISPNKIDEISHMFAVTNKNDLWHKIAMLGGLNHDAYQAQDFKDHFFPILENDLNIIKKYQSSYKKVEVDITVFVPQEDNYALTHIDEWLNYTKKLFEKVYFPGNHFYLFENTEWINLIMQKNIL